MAAVRHADSIPSLSGKLQRNRKIIGNHTACLRPKARLAAAISAAVNPLVTISWANLA
jgi:hypothetical protein